MVYFYPGMTDFQVYKVPFPADMLSKASVSYAQEDEVMLIKDATEFEDVEGGSVFSIRLSQEDTLRFKNNRDVYVQINLLSADGARAPSSPIILKCGCQYDRRVLGE